MAESTKNESDLSPLLIAYWEAAVATDRRRLTPMSCALVVYVVVLMMLMGKAQPLDFSGNFCATPAIEWGHGP